MSKKQSDKEKPIFINEIGFIAFIIIAGIITLIFFKHNGGDNIRSDGLVYYEYFTKIFIKHSLHDGNLTQFPMGTTLLQYPFLLVTYYGSKLFGLEITTGTEIQFHAAMTVAAFFYWALGIGLCYRLLRAKFSKVSSLLSCICISIGTMMMEYVLDMSSFSHIYAFFVCTLFFTYVSYYEKNKNDKNTIKRLLMDFLLGFILGLAAIIRNTNIVMGFCYLFYNVVDVKSFVSRIKGIFSKRIIVQIIGGVIPLAAQLLVWRIETGRWILYSYGDQSFSYALKPQVFRVLFSDAKGLFVFCPILLVALISMIAFRKDNPEYRVSQWVIFAFVTYFVAAWWCWWLGTAYGERMHCDILCVFIIPLASFFENVGVLWKDGKGKFHKYIAFFLMVFCFTFVLLNVIWFVGCLQWHISPNFATWYQMKNYFVYFWTGK